MSRPQKGSILRTFGHCARPDNAEIAEFEILIHFELRRGSGVVYDRRHGWSADDTAEWDFAGAEREVEKHKYTPLIAGEWLETWARETLAGETIEDLIRALACQVDGAR